MMGNRQKAQTHGLTGKPLLYALGSERQLKMDTDVLQVFYKRVCVIGRFSIRL